ncbi:putative serine/threonine-protein kinase YabT [Lentibacillus kapialis]|uniref:Serine/threonine-protein kinase YabT n=2 Tax=Lentibacillus kapialis TaxID=340214 RepID=A0A917PZA2_9BACI|nr:serine/threonine-protein kinase [Lentibacillus kapialis]GGK01161.1 putative serine/threonine-protein kinase YabT [Lentibacillus kapialis]
MDQAWKKQSINIRPGTVIQGKWHRNRYVIKRRLGQGAIGTVYLCEWNGQYGALKISDKATSMTVEVNVLKSLEKVQGSRLGPSLLDVDDWEVSSSSKCSFYVMEYLEGEPLSRFISRHGHEWTSVFMLQLLDDLKQLHQAGWVFGDFKSDNLIVLPHPPKVRWIDVGGTTQIGRAIKEYTEFYDRGYWGLGSRKAEPSYDLFALVMVFLNIYYPKRFEKGANPKATLLKKLNDVGQLRNYRECLKKALLGGYQSSDEMRHDLLNAMNAAKHKGRSGRRRRSIHDAGSPLIEGGGIILTALFYYLSSLILP